MLNNFLNVPKEIFLKGGNSGNRLIFIDIINLKFSLMLSYLRDKSKIGVS